MGDNGIDNDHVHEVDWDDDSEMMAAAVLVVVNNDIPIMSVMMWWCLLAKNKKIKTDSDFEFRTRTQNKIVMTNKLV